MFLPHTQRSRRPNTRSPLCRIAARIGGGNGRVCQLCKTNLNLRAPKSQLMEHVDSKHAKVADAFNVCFPGFEG